MDISSEKIAELLKNPDVVSMIATMASGLKSDGTDSVKDIRVDAPKDDILQSQDKAGDIELTSDKALPIIQKTSATDKRIALLQAIKPYINDDKRKRVDSLVKAIGVAGILYNYTGGFGNGGKGE